MTFIKNIINDEGNVSIYKYKGDNTKIAVTGDSAGAHLSAMIVNSGTKLSSDTKFEENLSFINK